MVQKLLDLIFIKFKEELNTTIYMQHPENDNIEMLVILDDVRRVPTASRVGNTGLITINVDIYCDNKIKLQNFTDDVFDMLNGLDFKTERNDCVNLKSQNDYTILSDVYYRSKRKTNIAQLTFVYRYI